MLGAMLPALCTADRVCGLPAARGFSGTGVAPSVEHVRAVSEGARTVPGSRVAVASGITPENVGPFLPLVDDFLVATGISSSFYQFDKVRVRDLAAQMDVGLVSRSF